MKYIVVELQMDTNGNVANIVTSHDDLPHAESTYHSILAAAAISDIPKHSATIISEEGFNVKNQCFVHQ